MVRKMFSDTTSYCLVVENTILLFFTTTVNSLGYKERLIKILDDQWLFPIKLLSMAVTLISFKQIKVSLFWVENKLWLLEFFQSEERGKGCSKREEKIAMQECRLLHVESIPMKR